ncbi:hypothetical protein F5X96DRAFT_503521 [Biscogniauxia mediterranea]|nr:hypothetical protein F5X96DRAFT_503521 [Biscogniauxia mediterranea]
MGTNPRLIADENKPDVEREPIICLAMASSSREPPILPLQEPRPRRSHSSHSQGTQTHSSTPDQSQSPTSRMPSYRTRYARISSAKGIHEQSEFYTDEDVRNHAPGGLPAAAASQVQYPNVNLLRRFGHLNNDSLMYAMQQLACLEDAVDDLYARASAPPGHPRLLNSLLFDKERFVARCRRSPDYRSAKSRLSPPGGRGEDEDEDEDDDLSVQMENLIANAMRISREYHEAFLWEHKSYRFSPVSHRAHLASFNMLRDVHHLDEEALGPWRAIDDLVTPEPDTLYRRFENLLYTKWSWIATGLHYCCRGRVPSGSAGDLQMEVEANRFRWAVKLVMWVTSSALLVVPFGVLYLQPLSKLGAFFVVLGFGAVFTLVGANLEQRTGRVISAATAYYAVLAAILSNLKL